MHVVHEAAAPSFTPVARSGRRSSACAQRYGLADRFILYVGTIEPRKNLPTLIDAFAAAPPAAASCTHQLVCVGPYGWLSRDIERPHRAARTSRDAIRFTGYVPFEDLPALYNLAEMFVFPSIYEGFGLPVIEAMACGAPVITGPRRRAWRRSAAARSSTSSALEADALGDALVALAASRDRRERTGGRRPRAARDVLVGARRARDARGLPATRRVAAGARRRRDRPSRVRPRPRTAAAGCERRSLRRRRPTCSSARRTSCASIPSSGRRSSPTRRSARSTPRPCVRERGYDVALFDAMLAESEAEWAAALDRHRPRVAVLYEDNFNYLSQDVPAAHARGGARR